MDSTRIKKLCVSFAKEKVNQPEEKRTDVNIATSMLVDCFKNVVDTLVLISADSDQIPTVQAIKKEFTTKTVKVYFPPERKSTEIFNLCKPIVFLGDNENKFKNSIMPNEVKNNLKTYTKPSTWKE